MKLDVPETLLAAASLMVAILALLVSYRTLFPPKRRIDGRILKLTRLINPIGKSGLKVLYGDSEIRQPYLITYSIRPTGRHAITTESFDQGRPIIVTFNDSRVVADLTAPNEVHSYYALRDNQIHIGPDLLKRGEENLFSFLLDGRPSGVDIKDHLIDVITQTNPITLDQQTERLKNFHRKALVTLLIIAIANGAFALTTAKRAVATTQEAQDLTRRALQLSDDNFQLFIKCSNMLTKIPSLPK